MSGGGTVPVLGWGWGQAGEVRAGDNVTPWERGLGMGSKTMVSRLGWLFVCVTLCLIPQLCSALVGGSPKSLLTPLSSQLPFPSFPGTAVTGEGFRG